MHSRLVETFQDAKGAKRPWSAIALAFREGRQQGGAGVAAFEKQAAQLSGYTVGMLRRFDAAMHYLESLPKAARPAPEVADLSFTAIELIGRIARHDSAIAREWLGRLGKAGTRVLAIRRDLKRLAGAGAKRVWKSPAAAPEALGVSLSSMTLPRSFAASERKLRDERMFAFVRDLLPKTSERVFLYHRPIGVTRAPVRVDAIAWLDEDYEQADGFEFVYAPQTMSDAHFSDQISRAVVASTFFRRHYIVFSGDSYDPYADRAVQALTLLSATSIGVISFTRSKPIVLRPKGVPVPDRRSLLKTICPKGRWA